MDSAFRDKNFGWDEILKKDKYKSITLQGNTLDNLDSTFFSGKVRTCGPIIKVGRKEGERQDQFTVRKRSWENSPISGCEDI